MSIKPQGQSSNSSPTPKISVVIPTYKKVEQLINNLSHNIPLLSECEIIIVNDDPSQSIKSALYEFPEIHLIEHEVNKGFSGAVNSGIDRAEGNYIMLLNSDVIVKDDSYKRTIETFNTHPKLFAIAFAQEEPNSMLHGKNRIYWKDGLIYHDYAKDTEPGITAWAEASAAIYDAVKLRQLGAFDELYAPFYWEDIDLSYRAWKQGYEVLFDPSILVEHHHESTVGSFFSKRYVQTIGYRNQFLFVRKNITDSSLVYEHQHILPRLLAGQFIRGNFGMVYGYIRSRLRWNRLQSRHRDHNLLVPERDDKEILGLFGDQIY